MSEPSYDVIIVGFGPVGAMLALLLKQQGLSVLVIAKDAEIERYPRAAHFDDEIIRVFQTVGLAHLSDTMETPPRYQYFDKNWKPFLSRLFPQGMSDQGYRHDFMFFQPDVERAMREHLAEGEGGPDLALGETVTRLWQDEHAAHVETVDTAGTLRTASAAWLVGCDGASSTVRKSIATSFDKLADSHKWYIVDVKLTDLAADPGMDQWEYCSPDRIVTYIPLSGPYRRYEFDVKPGESEEELSTPERTWALLSPWLQPDQAIILRNDIYRFHSLLASRWRDGRILLAGDAAHLMTPKLGQGLCTGIRDAANLAWKIGRVVAGRSSEALLETYEAERKGPAREYIEISAYMVSQIISRAGGDDSDDVAVEQIVAPRQKIGEDSLRDTDALAGTFSAQPFLSDGRHMDEVVGYRFLLLATDDVVDGLTIEDRQSLIDLDAVILRAENDLGTYLQSLDRNAILVRPDRYIAGSATTAQYASRLLARWSSEYGA